MTTFCMEGIGLCLWKIGTIRFVRGARLLRPQRLLISLILCSFRLLCEAVKYFTGSTMFDNVFDHPYVYQVGAPVLVAPKPGVLLLLFTDLHFRAGVHTGVPVHRISLGRAAL